MNKHIILKKKEESAMKLRKSLLVFSVAAFWGILWSPCGLFAQERDKIYTPEKSISEAIANNWALKAKKEKIDESTFVMKQTKADFYPKLSTSYAYTRLSDQKTTDPIPLGAGMTIPGSTLNSKDNYQWKMSLTQPLFTGFALTSAYELAKLGIDRSRTDFKLAELDLALQVKEAYFNILIADKGVEVAGKEVESLTSSVKVTQSFYKVGMIPINDLLKTEVELANARQNLVKALNAAKLRRSFFNTVLARPVSSPVEVEDILAYSQEVGDFETYYKRALSNRPEIKLIDIALLQADQQIRLAKSKYYPEAALSYDYIKEGDDLDVSGSDFHDASQWQAMAVLSWTFWEWGKTGSAVREKESLKRQILQDKFTLLDNIALEIKSDLLDIEVAIKNIPTTEKAVEQGEENLRVSEERYKAQVTTIQEVLDAQALLTRARVNYYRALYDQHLAMARLMRGLGEY